MRISGGLEDRLLFCPLLHLAAFFMLVLTAGVASLIYHGYSLTGFEDYLLSYAFQRLLMVLVWIPVIIIVKSIKPGSSLSDVLRNLSERDKEVLSLVVELMLLCMFTVALLTVGVRIDAYVVLVNLGLIPLYCLEPYMLSLAVVVALLAITIPFTYSLSYMLLYNFWEKESSLPVLSVLVSLMVLAIGIAFDSNYFNSY